jgi:hypothetical protein
VQIIDLDAKRARREEQALRKSAPREALGTVMDCLPAALLLKPDGSVQLVSLNLMILGHVCFAESFESVARILGRSIQVSVVPYVELHRSDLYGDEKITDYFLTLEKLFSLKPDGLIVTRRS